MSFDKWRLQVIVVILVVAVGMFAKIVFKLYNFFKDVCMKKTEAD